VGGDAFVLRQCADGGEGIVEFSEVGVTFDGSPSDSGYQVCDLDRVGALRARVIHARVYGQVSRDHEASGVTGTNSGTGRPRFVMSMVLSTLDGARLADVARLALRGQAPVRPRLREFGAVGGGGLG